MTTKRRGPEPRGIRREDYATEEDYQRDRKRKNNKEHYAANRAQRIARSVEWSRAHPEAAQKALQKTRLRRKLDVYALLGGKCVRCGQDDPRVLQVDHIYGAKEKQNERYRSGDGLYGAILTGKKPVEDFQLLCANCNTLKRWENGEQKGYKARRFGADSV